MTWAEILARNLLIGALLSSADGLPDFDYDSDWDLCVAKYLGIDGLEPW